MDECSQNSSARKLLPRSRPFRASTVNRLLVSDCALVPGTTRMVLGDWPWSCHHKLPATLAKDGNLFQQGFDAIRVAVRSHFTLTASQLADRGLDFAKTLRHPEFTTWLFDMIFGRPILQIPEQEKKSWSSVVKPMMDVSWPSTLLGSQWGKIGESPGVNLTVPDFGRVHHAHRQSHLAFGDELVGTVFLISNSAISKDLYRVDMSVQLKRDWGCLMF